MQRVLTQVVATVAILTTMGAAHGPNTMEKTSGQPPASTAQTASTSTPKPAKAAKAAYQVGPASWYGKDFHGKQTASGEIYNMYEMTAAHPDLPLGTKVRVTDLKNGKSVIVKVNDRGPLVPGRIIDLSYGAAEALGFTAKGVQKVRLDLVPPDKTVQSAGLR